MLYNSAVLPAIAKIQAAWRRYYTIYFAIPRRFWVTTPPCERQTRNPFLTRLVHRVTARHWPSLRHDCKHATALNARVAMRKCNNTGDILSWCICTFDAASRYTVTGYCGPPPDTLLFDLAARGVLQAARVQRAAASFIQAAWRHLVLHTCVHNTFKMAILPWAIALHKATTTLIRE